MKNSKCKGPGVWPVLDVGKLHGAQWTQGVMGQRQEAASSGVQRGGLEATVDFDYVIIHSWRDLSKGLMWSGLDLNMTTLDSVLKINGRQERKGRGQELRGHCSHWAEGRWCCSAPGWQQQERCKDQDLLSDCGVRKRSVQGVLSIVHLPTCICPLLPTEMGKLGKQI